MKIKEMKGKVKQFREEHPDLCRAIEVGGLIAVGEIIGWKLCCEQNGFKKGRNVILDDDFNRVLNHSHETYKTTGCSKLWMHNGLDKGLKLTELGKLADLCEEAGLNMEQELTHIIALGKPIIEK